jgi:hypothetical protein
LPSSASALVRHVQCHEKHELLTDSHTSWQFRPGTVAS